MSLVATLVMDVNKDSTVTDTDMATGSNPGLDVILVLGGKEATNIY